MSERPKSSLQDMKEKLGPKKEAIKANKAGRRIFRSIFRTSVFLKSGMRITPKNAFGLLEGSIIANPLYHPSDSGDELERANAQPGRWAAFDFKLPDATPRRKLKSKEEKVEQIFHGRLAAFLIDEVMDKEPDELTPIGTLDIMDLAHLLEFDTFSADELVRLGLLDRTTYGEAYAKVKEERFEEELRARRLGEDVLYQVTPKGSTLVFLLPDFGATKPKDEAQAEEALMPMPGLVRV